jgi:hypothetical protein
MLQALVTLSNAMLTARAIWTAAVFPHNIVSTIGATQALSHTSILHPGIMSWRSSGTNNEELVENMRRNGLLTTARVAAVRSMTEHGVMASEPSIPPGHETGGSCKLRPRESIRLSGLTPVCFFRLPTSTTVANVLSLLSPPDSTGLIQVHRLWRHYFRPSYGLYSSDSWAES